MQRRYRSRISVRMWYWMLSAVCRWVFFVARCLLRVGGCLLEALRRMVSGSGTQTTSNVTDELSSSQRTMPDDLKEAGQRSPSAACLRRCARYDTAKRSS